MMSRMGFLLSRLIWVHHLRIMYASAALFFVCGLIGPRYGSLLAVTALNIARSGVMLAVTLWLLVLLIRKRRPGFRLGEVVSEYSGWSARPLITRAGYTGLFISLAAMFVALGALLGVIGVFVFWRAT
jgi:hypothetical protein